MKKRVGIFCALLFCTALYARQRDIKQDVRNLESGVQEYKAKRPVYDRGYYDSLVKKASKRRWAFTAAVHYVSEDSGFNDCGSSVSLATHIFGTFPITIKDIYLFSKLSDDNNVRIDNCTARAPERGGVPIGGTGVVFGGFRDDLYTTLLAPIKLQFEATHKEVNFVTSGMFRSTFSDWEKFSFALGYTIPIKSRYHKLDFSYSGGELFRRGFVPDTTQRETSLRQFFRDYSDVKDFIIRGIFASKGLTLKERQRKSGIGDISLFGLLEYHGDHVLECGINLVLPTASKGGSSIIWEPVLGTGGAYLFNPFAQILVSTFAPYCNPFARIAVEVGTSFHSDTTRAPILITNDTRQQAQDITGLSVPDSFEAFYVDPFEEYDTTVPLLADTVPCLKKRIGSKVLFGVGNYVYKLFHVNFRWGLFYDYYHKGTDSFCSDCKNSDCNCSSGTININSLETNTDQSAHSISSNLVYKFNNYFELGAGGQFTVAGKNIAKTRTIYFSFVAVF